LKEQLTVAEVRLNAEARTEFGKGGARRTRRAGLIPAVIYGHGAEPRHVSLPAREFTNALKKGGANVLLTLAIDGKDELAIPKAIQRDPIKDTYRHIDLLTVRRGEKITIDVALHIVGEVARGALLAQESTSVSLEAEATHIPTGIEIDISALEIGTQVKASDLTLPSGSALAGDPDQILLIVNEAPSAEEMAAEGEGDATEAPTEPAGDDSGSGDSEPAADAG
jgi:large subunit ribosomal protein L25